MSRTNKPLHDLAARYFTIFYVKKRWRDSEQKMDKKIQPHLPLCPKRVNKANEVKTKWLTKVMTPSQKSIGNSHFKAIADGMC